MKESSVKCHMRRLDRNSVAMKPSRSVSFTMQLVMLAALSFAASGFLSPDYTLFMRQYNFQEQGMSEYYASAVVAGMFEAPLNAVNSYNMPSVITGSLQTWTTNQYSKLLEFSPSSSCNLTGNDQYLYMATGDFNNDNYLDVVGTNYHGLYVHYNVYGSLNCTPEVFSISSNSGGAEGNPIVSDLNGDGLDDIACAFTAPTPQILMTLYQVPAGGGSGIPKPGNRGTRLYSYQYPSPASFYYPLSASCAPTYQGCVMTGLGGNNINGGDQNAFMVYNYNANQPNHPLETPTVVNYQNLSSSISNGLATGDVNGDSLPDVITLFQNSTAWVFGVWLQHENGEFMLSQVVPAQQASGVEVHDLNGDGLNDLIFTGGSYYYVSLQQKTHAMGDLVYIPSGRGDSIAVYDLNLDGLPDISSTQTNGVGVNYHTPLFGAFPFDTVAVNYQCGPNVMPYTVSFNVSLTPDPSKLPPNTTFEWSATMDYYINNFVTAFAEPVTSFPTINAVFLSWTGGGTNSYTATVYAKSPNGKVVYKTEVTTQISGDCNQ